ncbi:MAG: hypothetical protein F6J95_016090 [Leptolyngbya sp. SIO1E4]|nr:hypothetical protein [Leptolyngbya sp. SIO1E4]
MTTLNTQSNLNSVSSGIGNDLDAVTAFCQNLHSEARLQQYRLEQQHQEIQALKDKVEILELHKATQLGQDKIIGFMVGAIVLSLLSLATSIFFSPSEEARLSLRSQVLQAELKLDV